MKIVVVKTMKVNVKRRISEREIEEILSMNYFSCFGLIFGENWIFLFSKFWNSFMISLVFDNFYYVCPNEFLS